MQDLVLIQSMYFTFIVKKLISFYSKEWNLKASFTNRLNKLKNRVFLLLYNPMSVNVNVLIQIHRMLLCYVCIIV